MLLGKGNRGFTLIEMLLVAALALALSVALAASFFQGLRIFDRLNRCTQDVELALFFEKITHDLKNSVGYSLIPYSVSKETLSFPVLFSDKSEEAGELSARPVRVTYGYEETKREIVRLQNDFPWSPEASPKREVLLKNVQSLQFSSEASDSGSPLKVSIFLEVGDSNRTHSLKKEVMIPSVYFSHRL